jgi:hypothetical protein
MRQEMDVYLSLPVLFFSSLSFLAFRSSLVGGKIGEELFSVVRRLPLLESPDRKRFDFFSSRQFERS